MGIKKEEVVLYTLDVLFEMGWGSTKVKKEQIASALDISANTLDLYLTNLARKGLIIRIKKHFLDDFRRSVEITEEGYEAIGEIKRKIEKEYLTPERHNIPTMVPVSIVMNRIADPLERIFFLALFSRLKRFDLPFYLETIKTSKQGNNIIDVMVEMEQTEQPEEHPVVETFFRTCFYGLTQLDEDLYNDECAQDPNTLLIISEASVKQGKYNNARMIYEHLLSGKVPLTQNQWTIASINLAFLSFKEGDSEKALKELNRIIETTDNKIMRAYTMQVKARVFAASGDDEEALRMYTSALNSFKTFGLPLLQAITHNNRGIVYFRLNELEKAQEEWERCRKLAKSMRTPVVEGCSTTNLANVHRIKGDLEKTRSYLESFYDFFKDLGDYESLAYLDLIFALYYLDKKDRENAVKHFRLSETIAYPSPSPMEREERRRMFIECAKKNGFEDMKMY